MTEDLLSHYDCIQSITMPIYKQISKKNYLITLLNQKLPPNLKKNPGNSRPVIQINVYIFKSDDFLVFT